MGLMDRDYYKEKHQELRKQEAKKYRRNHSNRFEMIIKYSTYALAMLLAIYAVMYFLGFK